MQDRVKPLTSIHNFRDYGGYATSGGARLRTGLLFRSGQHGEATVDDLAAVDAMALATVIDLRGNSERRLWPCARGPGFNATVLFADGETAGAGGAAHAVAAREVHSADDAHAAMIDLYSFMPHRPNLQAAFRHYFNALADGAGPSLVHCFAGKDRTGLAVALVHRITGVHDDDMMADYLLTNTAGNSAARVAAGLASIRRTRPNASDEAVAMLMSVQPAFLNAALGTIDAQWGGAEGYLSSVLGFDAAMPQRLRDALLD
jgi:protein-tyrosine phosphatase